MTNLNELKVAELKEIAKGYGIALSYTVAGKRHALNKAELIVAIEAVQAQTVPTVETVVTNEVTEIATVETVQVAPTVEVVADHVEASEIESDEKEITLLALSDVIPFAKQKLKEINCKRELHTFKQKLLATFGDKQQTRKRTLKSKWATQYNRLVMMFKQAELKLQ